MPRPSSLASVPLSALQAEIARRTAKLDGLIAQRDRLDAEIAQLQALAGSAGQTASAAAKTRRAAPAARVAKRKVRRVQPPTPAPGRKKRGVFKVTAEQFVLDLLKDRAMKTSELVAAWRGVGRGGKVDNVLTRLIKTGQIKRTKLPSGMGSEYSLT